MILLISVAAQTVAPTAAVSSTLRLDDCLRLAEAAPNLLAVAGQERGVAQQEVRRARANFLPQAEVLSSFVYNSPRLDDPTTFSFVSLNGIRAYTLWGTITQNFDTSGRLRAELVSARAGEEAARVSVEIARRDLRRGVTIAYYRLLLTRHLVTVIQEALQESERFAERSRLMVEQGEIARAELVKALTQVAFLQQAHKAAELEGNLANQELASFWTNEVAEPLTIADGLMEAIPTPDTEANPTAVPFQRRLEFSLFAAQRRNWEAQIQVARSARKPQFNFVLQYGLDATSLRWRERGYAAYFNLRIPVFDWGRVKYQTQQLQLRAEQLETNRTIAARAFARDYQNARSRVQQLYPQIALAREQVKLAEEDLSLSRLRFESGEGAALEVITAQNQVAQARTNYFTNLANYLTARIDLEVASGK